MVIVNDFVHEDKVKANINLWQMFKGLWPYGRGFQRYFWIATFAILVVGISSRLLPTVVGLAIDQGFLKGDTSFIVKMAVAYFLIELVYTGSQYVYNFFFQRFGNRLLFNLRSQLHQHVLNLPVTYFDRTPTGRIVTRLTSDTESLGGLAADGLVNLIFDGVVLISIVVAMFMISPPLAAVTLLVTPIFIWISFYLTEIMRDALRDSKKKFSELNSYGSERINGMKTVQILNLHEETNKNYVSLSQDYRELLMRSLRTSALLHPTMNAFNAVTISVALVMGGYYSVEDGLAVGSLVAFLMHIQDMGPYLREVLDKYQQFQNSLTSSERVFQLLDEKKEPTGDFSIEKRSGLEIQIKDLSFQYQQGLPLVLKNVSLNFKPGMRVALIGRTGSGKSTLTSLLMKFYSVPEKSIWVDGTPIESWSNLSLRRQIGMIQQDPFLFKGSLFENVSLGREGVSRETIQEALIQIGYWPIMERTGKNLDSTIEARGANLSAGERQLIAFARVMVHHPRLLILDEATANIDSESEVVIQRATEKILEGRTSIVVAHRLSTVQGSDLVVVLDQGEVAEVGPPSELLAKKGHYFNFLNADAEAH